MAGRGPQSFKKRQKEQQRKEKQQEKVAKRLDRKLNPGAEGEEELDEALELVELGADPLDKPVVGLIHEGHEA